MFHISTTTLNPLQSAKALLRVFFAVLALSVAAIPATGFAQNKITKTNRPSGSFVRTPIQLLNYGVICKLSSSQDTLAPHTIQGRMRIVDPRQPIDVTSRDIPAIPGISFGIQLKLDPGHAPIDATIQLFHPPLTDGLDQQHWPTQISQGSVSLNLYRFDTRAELVTGSWLFRVVSGGEILAQQQFRVVPANRANKVRRLCRTAKRTS